MLENNLREIRLKREISQVDLAKSAEVSRQTIHAVESGKYIPSVELALKIARVFNMPVESIFRLGRKK